MDEKVRVRCLGLLLVLLVACFGDDASSTAQRPEVVGSELSIDSVRLHMSPKEVELILGNVHGLQLISSEEKIWTYPPNSTSVYFRNGQVYRIHGKVLKFRDSEYPPGTNASELAAVLNVEKKLLPTKSFGLLVKGVNLKDAFLEVAASRGEISSYALESLEK